MSSASETAHSFFWVSGIVGLVGVIVYGVVTVVRDRKRKAVRREQRRASRRRR